MKPEEFIELVRRMREVQKSYFRNKNYADLAEARQLEKQVDAALKSFTPNLFQQ